MAPRGDEALERLRVGVDLVGADSAAPAGPDRRVDLEHVVEAETPLDLVLVARELVDRPVRLAGAQRLAEIALELEAVPDPRRVAARPREDAVGAPDLHRDEIRLTVDLREQARRLARRDPDPAVADDARADDAVDVREDARLRVVERLRLERVRQLGAEHEARHRQDGRARDEEDAQQRQRALERLSVPRMRGRARPQGASSRAVSAAAQGGLIPQT